MAGNSRNRYQLNMNHEVPKKSIESFHMTAILVRIRMNEGLWNPEKILINKK